MTAPVTVEISSVPSAKANKFWNIIFNPQTQAERSKRFWTIAGSLQLLGFWGAGGVAGAVLPAGIAAGLVVYTGLQALQEVADRPESSKGRTIARKVIYLLFGGEDENNQFRRRILDLVLSFGAAVMFGGATATGLMGGLCAGAVITLITTWQKGAPDDWFTKEELDQITIVNTARDLLMGSYDNENQD